MNKRWSLIPLSVLMLWPGTLPAAFSAAPAPLPTVDEINKLYSAEEYVKALDGLITILEANPEDIEAKLYVHKIAKQLEQREIDLMLTSPVDREAMVREAWTHLKKTPPSAIQDAWSRMETYLKQGHLLFAGDVLIWITANAPGGSWDKRQAERLLEKLPRKISKKANTLVEKARRPYNEAWRAHRDAHWETAVALWREVLGPYPSDSEIQEMVHRDESEIAEAKRQQEIQRYIAKAEESMKLKHFADAVANFKSALKLDPQNPDLPKRLEEALVQQKIQNSLDEAKTDILKHRYPQAVKLLTDILQVDPKNSAALALLSELEKKLTFSQAASLVRQVAPSIKPVVHIKTAPRVLLKPIEAVPTEPVAREVKISDIVQSNAYYNRGLMLYASDHLENAIEEFGKALQMNPHNDKAQHALARVRAELGGHR